METEIIKIGFRPIEDDDFDFLWRLHNAALKEYVSQTWRWDENWQRKNFAEEFSKNNGKIIVFENQDAGFFWFKEKPLENLLVSIRLLPEFQNKGIGTQIIKNAIKNSGQPTGLQVLKVNPARRLYERLGFQIVGETETHFVMTVTPK